jgi:hypothetical protein
MTEHLDLLQKMYWGYQNCNFWKFLTKVQYHAHFVLANVSEAGSASVFRYKIRGTVMALMVPKCRVWFESWHFVKNWFVVVIGYGLKAVTERVLFCAGAWGGIVVEVLRYFSEGPGIDSRWCHWIFQWHIPSDRTVALGLIQLLMKMSTRNIPGGVGGRCVRLTTSPP